MLFFVIYPKQYSVLTIYTMVILSKVSWVSRRAEFTRLLKDVLCTYIDILFQGFEHLQIWLSAGDSWTSHSEISSIILFVNFNLICGICYLGCGMKDNNLHFSFLVISLIALQKCCSLRTNQEALFYLEEEIIYNW